MSLDNMKKLKGTFRDDRAKGETPENQLIISIEPPEQLTNRAKLIFVEKAEILINQRMLTHNDINLLVCYSNSLDTYYNCIEQLNKEGLIILDRFNSKVVNPLEKVRKTALDEVIKISVHFGFSPKTRLVTNVFQEKSELQKFLES